MGALLDVRARGTSVEDDLNEAPDIISTTRRATTQPWQLSPSDLHGLDDGHHTLPGTSLAPAPSLACASVPCHRTVWCRSGPSDHAFPPRYSSVSQDLRCKCLGQYSKINTVVLEIRPLAPPSRSTLLLLVRPTSAQRSAPPPPPPPPPQPPPFTSHPNTGS